MHARLGGLQLAVMRVLWERGEATVVDVLAAIEGERHAAYSTIATVLARLERRGLVSHRTEGRTFIYRATQSEDQVGVSLVEDLIDRAFGGSPSQLVSHLLESDEFNRRELGRIKSLIAEYEAGQARKGKRSRKQK
jgi:BlaI family penicillinase repressor